MICPYCRDSETKVVDSRESEDSVRRRRECLRCKKRFTTYERLGLVEMMVVKKDRRREPFSHDKLRIGIQKACEKRNISDEAIDRVVSQIENELRNYHSNEIPSTMIGKKVMAKLKRLDNVAYIRFASVYQEFDDVRSFERELKNLKGR